MNKSNIDWQGLFNWSTQYHDGTKATSEFEKMSDEDYEWLTKAMEQYTFNDAERLKEICETLKEDAEKDFDGSKGALTGEVLYDRLDELMTLIELHERNSLNMALCGGLQSLITFVLKHPDDEARILSCQTFNQMV